MIKHLLIGALAALALVAPAFAAEAAPSLRIALVSDTHTTRGTAEDQPLYKERLDHVIASVNGANADLVLIAGDLTQGGKPEEMADFQDQIKGFHAPVWFVFGNHDVGNKRTPGQKGGVTAERIALAEKTLGPAFWSRTAGGVRVIGITSSLLGSGLPREADEWGFLENELKTPSKAPTLVLMHYPLYLQSPDEPGGAYWNLEPGPRARLLSLLRSGGVTAALSGHLHRPLTGQIGGIFLYTTPPVSFGLPRTKQAEGWTLVTLSQDGRITADFHPTDAPSAELPKKE
jgi:3',5'-cyclic AMP phosphodiesterase CpdA